MDVIEVVSRGQVEAAQGNRRELAKFTATRQRVSCVPFAAVPLPTYPRGVAWRLARRVIIEAFRLGLWLTIGPLYAAVWAGWMVAEQVRQHRQGVTPAHAPRPVVKEITR